MRIALPCDSLAPVVARRHLATLPSLGWLLGDAMLVATELVTNAVRHSSCHRGDVLVVSVSRDSAHVRVAVHDPGRSGDAARIARRPAHDGGLGLRIVEQLAVRWGSQRDDDGYEVWADLPLIRSTATEDRCERHCLPKVYSRTGG